MTTETGSRVPADPPRVHRYTSLSMKCDRCQQNEATIHDYKHGTGEIQSEVHLCEECAREIGVLGVPFKSVNELLQQTLTQSSVSRRASRKRECPECGLTWNDFRKAGLLGCPTCYETFEDQLGNLIERAHGGATHHVGKAPKRSTDSTERDNRIQAIRKQLAQALSAEQYERAAKLRDELTGLGASIKYHDSTEELN